MITNTSQISILVKDLSEAKTFYTEKLGFVVREEIEFSPDWSYLTVSPTHDNETTIELLQAENTEQKELIDTQAGKHVLLMFLTDDIQKDYEELKSRGVIFRGKPTSVPGGKGVGFEDLYGYSFDLYQPDSLE